MISPATVGQLVAIAVTLPASANIDELVVTPSAGPL
jgi:NADP-dependent 3-hydroxy acid dehydrogenase YdfG